MTQTLSHFIRMLTMATVAGVMLASVGTTSVRADAAVAEKALGFIEVLTVEALGLLGENNPDDAAFDGFRFRLRSGHRRRRVRPASG